MVDRGVDDRFVLVATEDVEGEVGWGVAVLGYRCVGGGDRITTTTGHLRRSESGMVGCVLRFTLLNQQEATIYGDSRHAHQEN